MANCPQKALNHCSSPKCVKIGRGRRQKMRKENIACKLIDIVQIASVVAVYSRLNVRDINVTPQRHSIINFFLLINPLFRLELLCYAQREFSLNIEFSSKAKGKFLT
jgi:hypothetical protein